jgi:PhzF family phenazine biosynthesis protein
VDFVTLDVFTAAPFSGNPLAVVFLPDNLSKPLSQSQKQEIAKEFNYSETIFIHPWQLPLQPSGRLIFS